jgi:hypothetical protein
VEEEIGIVLAMPESEVVRHRTDDNARLREMAIRV